MDDLARAEYPVIVATLPPGQAVNILNDRVKRISKTNIEIADWLAERRRVEEQYVQGLRKLTQARFPNSQSELGVFQGPWNRITESINHIAQTHHRFAERVEKDVEGPLRAFQQRPDVLNIHSIATNLTAMARDLEDAQDKSDKLTKRGTKASSQKVDAATAKLESATQQWESQAPFIFETLQALDESRINQLRDLLTQYQTHESDQAQQIQDHAAATISIMLEVSTEMEVQSFVQRVTGGRAEKIPTRTPTRQSSTAGTHSSATAVAPPVPSQNSSVSVASTPTIPTPAPDDASDHNPMPIEKGTRSSRLGRIGTVFNRRRQSMHGGFGQLSSLTPQKSSTAPAGGFGRIGSSHGRGVSPRPSTANLQDSGHLSALPETFAPPQSSGQDSTAAESTYEGTNGMRSAQLDALASLTGTASAGGPNGTQGSEPEAPAPISKQSQESQDQGARAKDSEGYTLPGAMDDPISRAQKEAAEAAGEENDQGFKLSIQNTPVEDEDPEAKLAALSSVVNTLKMGPATRRSGTVRGRRDVRNTIYMPSPSLSDGSPSMPTLSAFPSVPTIPGSPPSASQSPAKLGPVSALLTEASNAPGSDKESIRSSTSFASLAGHVRHPDMTGPGLNASIIESISVIFEDGVVKSASMSGEIALINNSTESESHKTHERIRINNFASLERIGPNRIFVHNSPEQPDQFSIDLSHLHKTSTAFSYKVFSEDSTNLSLAKYAPLLVKPAWKLQGDKLGLLLQYQLNPESSFTAPVTLHNVAFVVSYNGRATGAQTKPSGTHIKDRHLVYWRLGDVTLTNETQKIVCRIIGAEGVEPTPGLVQAKWEYISSADESMGSGISVAVLEEPPKDKGKGKEILEDDPFADTTAPASQAEEQRWTDVPLWRKLVSGDYEARASAVSP